MPAVAAAPTVGFGEALRFWLKLGCINFGGPTGQIAIMHQELVERRRWISEERFLHALNYCMLLPGPEATQLAVYVGWLLHRTAGGLVAGILFVLPGSLFMLLLSWVYAVHGKLDWVQAVFYGLRAAVIAIVAAALVRIAGRAFHGRLPVVLAAAAFIAIFFFRAPFPLIVLGAGLVGWIAQRLSPRALLPPRQEATPTAIRDDVPAAAHTRPSWRRALTALAAGLLAWWAPLLALVAWRGYSDVLAQEAVFFSKAAMVTFGGAYAVLAYLQQVAVEHYGWLAHRQMLDGLGLAETTPGPLILVTEFVGFLGAYRHPGGLSPTLAGVLGAAVTVWATFAPCFLWIFLGAPYIEELRGNEALNAALSAITAAVVGVILNLAVWFGLHTLFRTVREAPLAGAIVPLPEWTSLDPFALVVAVTVFLGMWRRDWGIVPVILGSAAAGLLWRMVS